MLQAITTKYFGPTNHRESRVRAKCQGKTIFVKWDDSLSGIANHAKAAGELINSLLWWGEWFAGGLDKDGTRVYVRRDFKDVWERDHYYTAKRIKINS
jgi:hypothetical protein